MTTTDTAAVVKFVGLICDFQKKHPVVRKILTITNCILFFIFMTTFADRPSV